jgi:hypothetical protein
MKPLTYILLSLAGCLCTLGDLGAQVVTFTSRTTFDAATTSQDIMTFDGSGYTFSGTPVIFPGNGPFPDGSGTFRFTSGANTATLWNGPATLINNTGSGIGIRYTGPGGSGVEIVDSGNIGTAGNAVLTNQGTLSPTDGITLTLRFRFAHGHKLRASDQLLDIGGRHTDGRDSDDGHRIYFRRIHFDFAHQHNPHHRHRDRGQSDPG